MKIINPFLLFLLLPSILSLGGCAPLPNVSEKIQEAPVTHQSPQILSAKGLLSPIGTEQDEKFKTAAEFSDFLIRSSLISTVPWDDAGSYIRFSVTFEADSIEREKEVLDEMINRMKKLKLKF